MHEHSLALIEPLNQQVNCSRHLSSQLISILIGVIRDNLYLMCVCNSHTLKHFLLLIVEDGEYFRDLKLLDLTLVASHTLRPQIQVTLYLLGTFGNLILLICVHF